MKTIYNSPPPPPLAYTVPQACAASAIGKTVLYSALESGVLPAKKLGKRTLILKTELQKFLANLEPYAPQNGGQNV